MWKFSKHVDEIDDSVTYIASIDIGGSYVHILCRGSNSVWVKIKGASAYPDRLGYVTIAYRVDKNPAVTDEWKSKRYSEKANTFVALQADESKFIKSLLGGGVLLFRLAGVTAKFPLTGSDAAINKLLEKCPLD